MSSENPKCENPKCERMARYLEKVKGVLFCVDCKLQAEQGSLKIEMFGARNEICECGDSITVTDKRRSAAENENPPICKDCLDFNYPKVKATPITKETHRLNKLEPFKNKNTFQFGKIFI